MMLHRPRCSTVRLRMAVTLLAAGLGACSGESAPLASTEIDAVAAAMPKAVCPACRGASAVPMLTAAAQRPASPATPSGSVRICIPAPWARSAASPWNATLIGLGTSARTTTRRCCIRPTLRMGSVASTLEGSSCAISSRARGQGDLVSGRLSRLLCRAHHQRRLVTPSSSPARSAAVSTYCL